MSVHTRCGAAVVALALQVSPLAAQADSAAGVAIAPAGADRLTLNDYLEWEDVQDPRLSPDGRHILYTRRWVDKLNDKWESAIWIMNADGASNRFLMKGSGARWSPDGTRIAFLAPGDPGGTQLFVKHLAAEGATQLTRLTESPGDLEWAPDGRSIAFRMLVPRRQSWGIESAVGQVKPRNAKWTEPPRVVEKLAYRRDRQGFVDDGFRHIFLVGADGGTPRQVTSGDWDHGEPQFMPDGRSIVFSALRVEEPEYRWRQSDLYAVNLSNGVVRQLTTRNGPDNNPVPSPDGRLIAYTGYDSTDATWIDSRLYVMNADGSNPRVLNASLDRTPTAIHWAPDGRGVYFTAESEGARNLHFASLAGEVRPVTRGAQLLTITGVGRGGLAVGTHTDSRQPADIAVFDVRQPRVRRLTAVNEDVLQGKRLGDVEELWYTSADGMRIQGWVVKPPDFTPGRKYPLMLSIHGGPHSMYNVGFNFAWQEHAANGYVVLYTNPRGSTGYGSAFGNAIKNAYPGKDYDDLMAGVDAVVARGYVDDRNMFVYGCSGGGVLTSWIVGHTDRFAAASANCPVTNWLSFVGTTDGPSWYRNFEKLPWEDPSEHLRRSPIMHVGKVKTPTMLMTGVNDLRTPISQTEEFYQALKLRRVPTAMIRFNDEWHGTSSKPSNFLRTQLYLRSWFERHGTIRKAPVAMR